MNFDWMIKKLLSLLGAQKTLIVQLDITNACNLNCKHCYQTVHSSAEDMSFDKWEKIIGQISSLAGKLMLKPHFGLSGGEPTVNPQFIPILKYIRASYPDCDVAVLSNGTSLREEVIEAIGEAAAKVQLSLDGPDAESHDFVRGRGSFDKTMLGLERLQAAGIYVTFQTVLSRRTAAMINAFFDMAARKKVRGMNFTRFVPQGRGLDYRNSGEDVPLYKDDLKRAYEDILAASRRTGVYTSTNLPLFVLISPELGMHNRAGFQGLVIDHKGNLKVSSRTGFILGDVLESGLENLFLRHPVMVRLRKGEIEGCSVCPYFSRCGGDRNASYETYGDFFKKDPGCWV
jgi:radical SAM protein with 4Fe4S-binding SPASM domain